LQVETESVYVAGAQHTKTLSPFQFGPNPGAIAITPNGAFAYVPTMRDNSVVYVPNSFSNTVSVIDTATNTVIATIPTGDGPRAVAFPTRTPTSSLIAQVQALVAGGGLTEKDGDKLIGKLEAVQTKLNNGQTGAACNQLSAFINQVNAFINSGSLSASQGQALIQAANVVRTNIGC